MQGCLEQGMEQALPSFKKLIPNLVPTKYKDLKCSLGQKAKDLFDSIEDTRYFCKYYLQGRDNGNDFSFPVPSPFLKLQ